MAEGTIAIKNGAKTLTGTDTAFKSAFNAGDFIVFTAGNVVYTLAIKSVDSATALTLVKEYTGPSVTGAGWEPVKLGTMNQVTMEVVAQVTEALRGLNADKANWQQVFSNADDITITLPDGHEYTGPSWNKISSILTTTDIDKLNVIADQVNTDSAAASESKDAAAKSASAAAESEKNAADSENNAADSASAAADSAEEAKGSAGAAADSADSAAESAAAAAAANPNKCLLIDENLADVPDPAEALQNLMDGKPLSLVADAVGAYDAVTLRQLQAASGGGTGANMSGVMNNYIGAVEWFNGSRALLPAGYIAADGQLLDRADEPDLWAAVEAGMLVSVTDELWLNAGGKDFDTILNRGKYSTGDGENTFRVPDLNGVETSTPSALFLRGSGKGQNGEPGDVFADGVPNITGSTSGRSYTGAAAIFSNTRTGAIYSTEAPTTTSQYAQTNSAGSSIATDRWMSLNFDASRSSPVYGRAGEVRPKSVTGIWIIRANGAFQAADTNFNVIAGDEKLPSAGVTANGGEIASQYQIAGAESSRTSLTTRKTIGGASTGRLTVTDTADDGTKQNGNFDFHSNGSFSTSGDILASGAAVIGENDGIAMAIRPATKGQPYYLSGRSADNAAEWTLGKLTAGSGDVTWRVGSVPSITLGGTGTIDIKAAGNINVDRQIVSSLAMGGSWDKQYSTLAPYYIDTNRQFSSDTFVPMLKQKYAVAGGGGAVTFGFVTPVTTVKPANPDAAIHILASDPKEANSAFRFKVSGDIQTSRGLVAFTGSDVRLKTNITDALTEEAVSRVEKLRPREFNWKGEGLPENETTKEYRARRRRGFIAQELDQVSEAYAIPPPSDDAPWGWEPSAIVADLVLYVRALKQEIAELKRSIADTGAAAANDDSAEGDNAA